MELELNKIYKIPGPFGSTIFARYIRESELAYHFCFDNNWKDYPGHILKNEIES